MRTIHLAVALLLLGASLGALAQSPADLTRIHGDSDSQFPTPMHPDRNGQDVSAIQQLTAFLKSTNLKGWRGVVATGTIIFDGDPTTYGAQLSIASGNSYRLDVQKPDGTESTIVNGLRGVFAGGQPLSQSVGSDIAFGGLLTVPRLLATGYPLGTTTVLDDGSINNNGVTLHRITLDDPAPQSDACSSYKTVDLYFDPTSNLLVSTAINGRISSSDDDCYFVQMSYGNYQPVAGSLFPFDITESLNGQLQWDLKITSATLSAPSSSAIFTF